MISFRLSILHKELRSWWNHPVSIILVVVFVAGLNFFFFRAILVQRVASLSTLIDLLPWFLVLLAPAVTMRLLAEEERLGTMETLRSQPISPVRIVIEKWLSAVVILAIAVVLTTSIPMTLMAIGGTFDTGQLVAQYGGTFILAAALAAIGIWASSLSKNQIVAFILAFVSGFILMILGSEVVLVGLKGVARSLASALSLLSRYEALARGAIDLRDTLYFFSIIVLALVAAAINVTKKSKGPPHDPHRRRRRIAVAMLWAVVILLNVVAVPLTLRWDLTQGDLYTLSSATRTLLKNLPEDVNVTFYTSQTLPASMIYRQRDVADVLEDMRRVGGGKLKVEVVSLGPTDARSQEVIRNGVIPVQFNVFGQQQFTAQQGFFGLVIAFGQKKESIPFIDETSTLEYDLARRIKSLTNTQKRTIALISGRGQKQRSGELNAWVAELERQYRVVNLALPEQLASLDQSLAAVAMVDMDQGLTAKEQSAFKRYLDGGGSMLIASEGVAVDAATLNVTAKATADLSTFTVAGLTIEPTLAFDVRSNENVTVTGGILSYVVPYPFWLKALAGEHPITRDINAVVLPWASTLAVKEQKEEGWAVTPLLTTTRFGGLQRDAFTISPQSRLTVDAGERKEHLIAASAMRTKEGKPTSRAVVVGDSDFLTRIFLSGELGAANRAFALSLMDWLTQDESLLTIRSKNRLPSPLVFASATQATAVQMGNTIGVPLFVALYGVLRRLRRKTRALKIVRLNDSLVS